MHEPVDNISSEILCCVLEAENFLSFLECTRRFIEIVSNTLKKGFRKRIVLTSFFF